MDLGSFRPYMEDIKRELSFKDDIAQKADMFLENIWQQNRPRLIIFVGIHVRGHEYEEVTQIMHPFYILNIPVKFNISRHLGYLSSRFFSVSVDNSLSTKV